MHEYKLVESDDVHGEVLGIVYKHKQGILYDVELAFNWDKDAIMMLFHVGTGSEELTFRISRAVMKKNELQLHNDDCVVIINSTGCYKYDQEGFEIGWKLKYDGEFDDPS